MFADIHPWRRGNKLQKIRNIDGIHPGGDRSWYVQEYKTHRGKFAGYGGGHWPQLFEERLADPVACVCLPKGGGFIQVISVHSAVSQFINLKIIAAWLYHC